MNLTFNIEEVEKKDGESIIQLILFIAHSQIGVLQVQIMTFYHPSFIVLV